MDHIYIYTYIYVYIYRKFLKLCLFQMFVCPQELEVISVVEIIGKTNDALDRAQHFGYINL